MSVTSETLPTKRRKITAMTRMPPWPPQRRCMQPGMKASITATQDGCPMAVSATQFEISAVAKIEQEFTPFMLTLTKLDSQILSPDMMFTVLKVLNAGHISTKM